MYGTVGRFKLKSGRFEDARALFEEWDRDFKPKVDGALAGYTYRLDSDPNTLIVCAVFRDKAAYLANADNPEQDKWFRRLADLLDGEAEWNDGEIIQGP